jgi:hypothetical protein
MRRAGTFLIAMLALGAIPVACSSSSSTPSAKPADTVDCHTQPPSSGSQIKCAGICIAHDACSDAGEACPAGLVPDGYGTCPNEALCCRYADASAADARLDATVEDAADDGG